MTQASAYGWYLYNTDTFGELFNVLPLPRLEVIWANESDLIRQVFILRGVLVVTVYV
jgi:hypothetical protein